MNPENPQPGRGQQVIVLTSLLMLTAAVGLFMLRQVFLINAQVNQAELMVNDYKSNALPKITWFVDNLKTFGKSNPDFNPILAKYNLLGTPGNTSAPIAAPVPKK